MKYLKVLLKVSVVLCSICLLSGFVAYRAGAFDTLIHHPTMPGSKSHQLFLDPTPSTDDPPTAVLIQDADLMSSSKSIAPLIRPPVKSTTPPSQAQPEPTKPAPTILPGSKSAPIFIPDRPPVPNDPAPSK